MLYWGVMVNCNLRQSWKGTNLNKKIAHVPLQHKVHFEGGEFAWKTSKRTPSERRVHFILFISPLRFRTMRRSAGVLTRSNCDNRMSPAVSIDLSSPFFHSYTTWSFVYASITMHIFRWWTTSLRNSQLPNCKGQLCISTGNRCRYIGQLALMVNLQWSQIKTCSL
jgi:hypothetical protein